MKAVTSSMLAVFLSLMTVTVHSQEPVKDFDQVYGLDQTLCNGIKYNFIAPAGTRGDQYLVSSVYFAGSVILKERCYQNVILNYDIFNQRLLLKYADEKGMMIIIEVSQGWLKGFSLGTRNFELLDKVQVPGFYQVIGEGPARIAYFWRKNLNLNGTIGSSNYVFSKPIRDAYVVVDGQFKPFNSRRSFLRIIDPVQRQEIKNYLRKNRIRVNKSSDQLMTELINFISKIK